VIRHRIEGHTAFVTLENPPANTWTPADLGELEALVHALEADRAVYAAVLTGAGEKFFSAGADLKSFHADKVLARHFIARFGAAFGALMNARLVTIAAINGYAMGGGLEWALSCDVRIAESHAQMGLPEPSVGLLPAGCGTQNLPWLIGEGWAKRMILTNERVDAATALRIGLVQEVVEKGASRRSRRARSPRARASSTMPATGSRAGRAWRSSASGSWTSSTTATRPKAWPPSWRSASPHGRTIERRGPPRRGRR
jgi:enoyl-CoA hydratase/carnithine racemase